MNLLPNHFFYFFKKYFLFGVIVIITNLIYGQEYNQQLELSVSNDKFVNRDQYYTSGVYITYKKVIENNFFSKNKADKLQYALTLGNEIYTPKNISSTNVNDFDRPYAGWTYGKYELTTINDKSAFIVASEIGVTGKESLSGDLQTWYHNLFGINSSPPWTEEIAFKILFNIKAAHIFNWKLNQSNALDYKIATSLGTKDIFLDNDIRYVFGRFNGFKRTSRNGVIAINNKNEFYGFVGVAYRYVAHNALIHGSLFKDEVLFTTPIENHLLKLEIGGVVKVKRNTFKLVYNYNSKETLLATSHAYGTISYAISF